MMVEKKLMEKAGAILQERGRAAVNLAKENMLRAQVDYKPLRDALRYFMEDWKDFLHPALVSLACEAVGGKPEATAEVGAALVLLAGGADIHDDIIDESIIKWSEKTVYGKFGKDLAILVGDALLLKGVYMLHEACGTFESVKKNAILDLVKSAFLEISGAEAAEAGMRGRIDIPKQVYMEIIRHKVAAGEVATRIGALFGDGMPRDVETLAEYGRVFGVLFSMRDEFVDVFEKEELSNRVEKEVLPLPIIVTLADESKKSILLELLKGRITEEKIEKIVDVATGSDASLLLVSEMKQMVEKLKIKIKSLRYCKEELDLILTATLEDL
jgi:geranylgeranyl diphosphate synthase type I